MSLSQSDLLTMKYKVVLPPAGKFQKEDLYTRKCWRRIQHLANEFCCRMNGKKIRSTYILAGRSKIAFAKTEFPGW